MTPPGTPASTPTRGITWLALLGLALYAGQAWALMPVRVYEDGRLVADVPRVLRSDVAGVLQQLGMTLAPEDGVIPDPSARLAPGMSITVTRAFPVPVKVDGRVITGRSVGGITVSEWLRRLGVTLGPLDRVTPDPATSLTPGLEIRVVRVDERVVRVQETVPYRTLRWAEPRWERGRQGLLRKGQAGLVEHTERLRYEDDQLVSRTRLATKVLRPRVDEIIGIGTRVVWRTVQTPRGPVRYREAVEMVATAYYPGPESTGNSADGLTATGLRAGHGVVAVDPRVIPLGTRLYVPGYGFAIAGDVGGAIKGNRIDLGYSTLREALHFGRRRVTVYVLD